MGAVVDGPSAARDLPNPANARVADGERIYAIGDVHGRFDLFRRLIAAIRADGAARDDARVSIVLLGDIVDRGPGSADLVRLCMEFRERSETFIVLKGNHEAAMVHALRGDRPALSFWLRNGGGETLKSWAVEEALVDYGPSPALLRSARREVGHEVITWLDELPLTHISGDYLFVHGGIRPGVELARQTSEDLLWIRDDFLGSEAEHGHVVVHGHSMSLCGIELRANRIGIDTGAYQSDILTALGLEGDRRWILDTGDAG